LVHALLNHLGIDYFGIPSEVRLIAGGFIPVTASYLLTIEKYDQRIGDK